MKGLYLLLLLALSGCDRAGKESVENLYYLEDPLYEVYFSSDLIDAEAALKDILALVENYEDRGFDVNSNFMYVHYRLYDLYQYDGKVELAALHLQKAAERYALLDPVFRPSANEDTEQNLHNHFKLIEETHVPAWRESVRKIDP